MELRHVFHKLAIVLTTVGMYACQNTDFYQKVQANGYNTPGDTTGGFTTGGTTSGGAPTGGSSGGGSGGSTPVPTPTATTTGGTGNSTISHNEIFTATAFGRIDILWVVDDSGSMADEQANLAANFDQFANSLAQEQIDFKMSVTTTDCSNSTRCGATRSGSNLLTSAYMQADFAQFESAFMSAVQAGTSGSGHEQPIAAGLAFLDKNPSFPRSNAYLAVVFVGDEDDQSPNSVAANVAIYQSYKASNPGYVKLYNISDINDVQSNQGITHGSVRTQQFAVATSADSYNIYANNFSSSLLAMAQSMQEVTSGFALGHPVVEASIVVKVNGVVTNGWSFDPATKVVTIPGVTAGASIEITYDSP